MIDLINKMRLLQGFSMLDYDEATAMAAVWLETLKRKHVTEDKYEEILQAAFDQYTSVLQEGRQPPNLDLALLIAMFDGRYRIEYNDYKCDDCRHTQGLVHVEGERSVLCEHPRPEARGMRVLRR